MAVLSVIITAMMVVILVGNILVVIAIFTERNLTGVQGGDSITLRTRFGPNRPAADMEGIGEFDF